MDSKTIKQRKKKADQVPILVIEPNADHWLLIRSSLVKCFPEGIPLWINHTGQAEAYLTSLLEKGARLPQLIVMELYVPDRKAGLSLLKFIKSNLSYQLIPVIILSESMSAEDVAMTYRLSIATYSTKPKTPQKWCAYFDSFRRYWWELVCLPRPAPLGKR